MSDQQNSARLSGPLTRRQLIAGVAVVAGSVAAGSELWGEVQQTAMKELPGTAENQKRTPLHQEAELKASPQRLYQVLPDSKQFAACRACRQRSIPKRREDKSSGAMSNGCLTSELSRRGARPIGTPGVYSIVRFDLKPQGPGALLVLDHAGFPEGDFDHLTEGWRNHYTGAFKPHCPQG